jgi:Siphovirus Gp157
MSTLLELNDKLEHLAEQIDLLESETIPVELHEAYLEILNEYCETESKTLEKLDNIMALIQSRKRWAQIRKQEYKRLQKLVELDENTVRWLQEYLLKYLEAKEIKKLRTKRFNCTVATNGGLQPIAIAPEIDPKKLPRKYRIITYTANKEAIREALLAGEKLSFAYFEERGKHLRIK